MNKETTVRFFRHIPILNTDRLILRKILPSDHEDVYEYSSKPEVTKFLLWSCHPSLEYTRQYIEYLQGRYKIGDFFDWAITLKDSGKMIGTCGFTKIDDENKVAEIGYVLNPDYWNLGLATEAAEIVLEFAFETMNMHRVEAKFMFGNDASLTVMKKLGMKFEGYHRDAMLVKGKYRTIGYASILRNEYYNNKQNS